MNQLKDREQKILDFMKDEIRTKGYPPTVREICSALHIKSTSTAHKDIASLVKQGYLKKDPSKPRALMVVDMERDTQETPFSTAPSIARTSSTCLLSAELPQVLRFWQSRI